MQRSGGQGAIPKGWRLVRLGDAAEVNPRRPRLSLLDDKPVTFLPMAAIAENSQGIIARESRPYFEVSTGYTYFEENDFLFSKITPCLQNGKHALATDLKGGFGFGSTEFHVVRACSCFASRFMFRVLTQAHIIDRCAKSFTGTAGQQRVQPETLKDLPILLPPLPEQRAIATVLDSIDDAIEGTEAVIAATQQLRDSLLHQLLTRGVPGWHTAWKEAPGLGTIPAGWEVVRLGEVAEVNPKRPRLNMLSDTLVTFLPMAAVAENAQGIMTRDLRPYGEVSTGYTYFEENDFLFSKITPCLQNGKHTLATGLKTGFGFGTTEFHVVRACYKLEAGFMCRVLTQPHIIDRCAKSFTGTAGQQRIQPETLKDLPLSLPPLPEQEAIAGLLDGVDMAIGQAKHETNMLKLLKESTADALLTGRVRVGDWEG